MMKATKKYGFTPDYAIPPGETLKDIMESLDMPQKELATRLEMTAQSLNRIFKGEQPITYETANKLEFVTHLSARMWNKLEANYREQLAKIKEEISLKKNIAWLKTIPVKELVECESINKRKDPIDSLKEVLKFYEVSSVSAYKDVWDQPAVAARRSPCFETNLGHASAWIRRGEILSREISCAPYDREKFLKNLSAIRNLTTEPADVFILEIQRLCAEAGVAFVMLPRFTKVPWGGASKWLKPDKAMILLSLFGKSEDKFWFNFFHETGHILHDSKKFLYINDKNRDNPIEKRADEHASSFLIPAKYRKELLGLNTKAKVIVFANKIGISPGIVAGQYQFATKKWHVYNGLIQKLKWA